MTTIEPVTNRLKVYMWYLDIVSAGPVGKQTLANVFDNQINTGGQVSGGEKKCWHGLGPLRRKRCSNSKAIFLSRWPLFYDEAFHQGSQRFVESIPRCIEPKMEVFGGPTLLHLEIMVCIDVLEQCSLKITM